MLCEVARCKFSDEVLRKFLYEVIVNYKGKIGSGNLLSKILNLQIPLFKKNSNENRRIMEKIMGAFLKAVKEKTALEEIAIFLVKRNNRFPCKCFFDRYIII